MENYIDRNNFLNRLSALQKLCSDTDSNYPSALLFVAGPDGRNNKGSVTVLKYLLRGAVSKDLFDETMESEFQCLEEMVLLVKQSSLTVIWSHEMKEALTPLFQVVPHLVEYISTSEEEDEMDLLQARKCCDFKRMMLESVKQGGGVGIPIPIGYDDIQDIESWPMLQAFALDHVYCPTGFFTARYNVADITAHLEILFRTVDGYYLDNAIRTMSRSIAPHMVQAIGMLDASTAEQRMRVTADDVVGPLEILYDFGEMETAGTVDAGTKPVVLFGPDTAQFGAVAGAYPAAWRTQVAGRSLHVVMEGCEPSSGLRWCRTYFLQRGRTAATIDISNDLIDAEEDADEQGDSKHSDFISHADGGHVDRAVSQALLRLEGLYVKLMLGLRLVVKSAFAKHNDVLEAGTEVQTLLGAILKGSTAELGGLDLFQQEQWRSLRLDDRDLVLRPSEQLQVHMDCANAVGEIVSIEDVDDMGGSCWTYIRVAVHGIEVGPYGAHPATVAVGDTFLFSSHRSSLPLNSRAPAASAALFPDRLLLQGDGCCITHPLPYYRCLIGAGPEEMSSRKLLSCTRSTHLLSRLGLGKSLDYTGTGMLTLTVLTDHPVVPYFEAELRTFAEGFLVEKMDGAMCLPALVSIGQHVDRVWTVDSVDFMAQASKLMSPVFLKERNLPDIEVPSGLLFIFRLKADDSQADGMNPLQRTLPMIGSAGPGAAKHVALVVPAASRSASAMSSACNQWRVAMRMYDVQEHRGAEVSLPDGILRAYLSALDFWKEGVPSMVAATDTSGARSSSFGPEIKAESNLAMMTTALSFARHASLQVPGAGYYAMRCIHAASDAQRLASFDYSAVDPSAVASASSVELVVVVGHPGSGASLVSAHLARQLADTRAADSSVRHVIVDFTAQEQSGLEAFVEQCASKAEVLRTTASGNTSRTALSRPIVLVSVVSSAENFVSLPSLVQLLEYKFDAPASAVISVVAPGVLREDDRVRYAARPLSETGHGLGFESWRASVQSDLLQPTCCDVVLLVEDASGSSVASRELRDFLAVFNPAAQVVKLSPANLRLDQESLETIQSVIQGSGKAEDATARQATAAARGQPAAGLVRALPAEAFAEHRKGWAVSHPECPAFVGCGITTVHLNPSTLNVSEWNLQSVLQTVQLLFPSAKPFTSAVDSTWKVPAVKAGVKTGRFKRLIQLATAKALSQRQEEQGRRIYNQTVERLRASKSSAAAGDNLLQRLIRGLRSIHGVLAQPGGLRVTQGPSGTSLSSMTQSGAALALEANCAFAVLRASPHTTTTAPQVGLVIQGVLGKQEIGLLHELFAACAQYTLPRKASLTIDQVGLSDRLRIQNTPRYADKFALPGNWWFDGQTYVDIAGTRRALRPDIDKLVEVYVDVENARIAEYNEMLLNV